LASTSVAASRSRPSSRANARDRRASPGCGANRASRSSPIWWSMPPVGAHHCRDGSRTSVPRRSTRRPSPPDSCTTRASSTPRTAPDRSRATVCSPPTAPPPSFPIPPRPRDTNTWSVTVFGSSGDRPLTQLRHADRWTAVVAACPLHAHWLEGEPTTGVLPMAGILDRYRRPAADGRPIVTGLALVGDSWACTNPSLGRGIALGLAHAARLRDVARTDLGDPLGFALAWDRATETELTPWYRATVAVGRARLAEIEAIRAGTERPRPTQPAP